MIGEPYTSALTSFRLLPRGSIIRQPGVSVRPLRGLSPSRFQLLPWSVERYRPLSLRLMVMSPLLGSITTPHSLPKPGFSCWISSTVVGCQSGAWAKTVAFRHRMADRAVVWIVIFDLSGLQTTLARSISLLPQAKQVPPALDVDAARGHGRRRPARIAEVARGQHVGLGAGADNVALAGADAPDA